MPKLGVVQLMVTCKFTTCPKNTNTAAQAQYFSRERRIVLNSNVNILQKKKAIVFGLGQSLLIY